MLSATGSTGALNAPAVFSLRSRRMSFRQSLTQGVSILPPSPAVRLYAIDG